MKRFLCATVVLILLITGCRTIEVEKEQSGSIKIPETYSGDDDNTLDADTWWKSLVNDELNDLIAHALENSFDIKLIQARLSQAQASLAKQKASLLPELDYSLGGQKKGTQVKTSRSRSSVYDGSHSWDASLTSTWTPDIWGENRALEQSKQLDMAAITNDLTYTRQELAAQVSEVWIDIIATRKKMAVLESQVELNETQLDLQELRYANGKADALDVSQQREVLAQIRSQGPLLERQEKTFLNTLAFISGDSSAAGIKIETQRFPEIDIMPSPGIPSDLLNNRPDIQAARQRLSSSLWEVAAKKADLLPSLNLSARALFSSGQLDLLFSNWVATLTAAITGPIFDGGYKQAEVDRATAAAQEQLHLYAQTVARSIRQVEDSLVTIDTQDDFIKLLEEELELARLTLVDALLQYWNGKSSYLNYLTVFIRIQNLERQLIGEKAIALKERINLYRMLGYASLPNEKTPAKWSNVNE